MKKLIAVCLAITGVIASNSILAATAVKATTIEGQWTGQFYNIADGATSVSDGNCFLRDGTWYNTVAPGVHGHWYQKGDDLYINAVADNSEHVYSSNMRKLNKTTFVGEHQHWATDGSSGVLFYLKETLTFKKVTCDPAP